MTPAAIMKYTDSIQRMKIAREEGIISRQTVYNVIHGKSKNWTLLRRLVELAKENQKLVTETA